MSVNDYDHELYELIQELVLTGELEEGTPEHGIALFTIDCGYDALSPKQKAVYDRRVVPLLRQLTEQQYINARMASAGD